MLQEEQQEEEQEQEEVGQTSNDKFKQDQVFNENTCH